MTSIENHGCRAYLGLHRSSAVAWTEKKQDFQRPLKSNSVKAYAILIVARETKRIKLEVDEVHNGDIDNDRFLVSQAAQGKIHLVHC